MNDTFRALCAPTPQPPADGEVAELVAWLQDRADSTSIAANANRARRIADLLQHQHPQPAAEGPTVPNSKLHRQELTPLEITLLIEALDFAIGDIKARPNSSKHVAVRAKLKRSISPPTPTICHD